MVVVLAVSFALASALMYVAFRRYPDDSALAAVQWMLFYVVTVIYPVGWTVQHFRLLRRLGLDDRKDLRQHAWAPMIVGVTSLAIALSLLLRLSR